MPPEPEYPSIYQLERIRGPRCTDSYEDVQENECEAAGLEAGAQWNPVFRGVGVDEGEFVQPQLNVFAALSSFLRDD